MSFLYPAMLTLALTGLSSTERGSAVGTVSSFFDLSQGVGALILGVVAAVAGYRGAFVAGAVLAVAALVLLRSGTDARVHEPVDHEAAAMARRVARARLPGLTEPDHSVDGDDGQMPSAASMRPLRIASSMAA